ncbi:hypothetical protein BXZ70DRAFT_370811 [Cristinia sonorae]|uniref:Uncharacterized protein n=1 Tax=Cristinia sonorae TaxID=1940300 RepID=A0A8K0UIX7_9AGAR|nr:hypothetical protein BXZ70DRAFT_370811 [Cristinia sonorae]
MKKAGAKSDKESELPESEGAADRPSHLISRSSSRTACSTPHCSPIHTRRPPAALDVVRVDEHSVHDGPLSDQPQPPTSPPCNAQTRKHLFKICGTTSLILGHKSIHTHPLWEPSPFLPSYFGTRRLQSAKVLADYPQMPPPLVARVRVLPAFVDAPAVHHRDHVHHHPPTYKCAGTQSSPGGASYRNEPRSIRSGVSKTVITSISTDTGWINI